jgi:hypothetical protein
MRVVTQVLAAPKGEAGTAATVLEQRALTVEVDLGCPDQPDELLELISVSRGQLRTAGVVRLAEYQGVPLRERTESHLHIEIRCRPDHAPRFRKEAESTAGNPVRSDEDVGPAHSLFFLILR